MGGWVFVDVSVQVGGGWLWTLVYRWVVGGCER